MKILKQVIPNIVKPLTYICNKSFIEGCFPDSMKISRIVPIFKAGDKNELDNYRPISILPQSSKVLEKLFENRLLNIVEKNNVLNQYIYINMVLDEIDQQQLPCLIYLRRFQLFSIINFQL